MALFIFIIGLVLGSFYLVIGTRLPKKEDVLTSRSRCDHCHKILKWYNLIPIFSYVFQKGKCSYCHEKIDILHLIVELVTGISFLVIYLIYGFSYEFFIGFFILSLTIIIYISDFKYLIILDSPLIVSGIGIIITKYFYLGLNETIKSILCGLGIFIVMLSFQKIGELIFKKEALGGGDVKLGFIIGLILNFQLALVAIILSTFLALPYSVASLYLIKNNEVAYGPFLAGALLIVFFTQEKFLILLDFLLRF